MRPYLLKKLSKGTVRKRAQTACATVPLTKLAKGTVRKWAQTACATVPFEKIEQRHGQKVGANGVCDRAF